MEPENEESDGVVDVMKLLDKENGEQEVEKEEKAEEKESVSLSSVNWCYHLNYDLQRSDATKKSASATLSSSSSMVVHKK